MVPSPIHQRRRRRIFYVWAVSLVSFAIDICLREKIGQGVNEWRFVCRIFCWWCKNEWHFISSLKRQCNNQRMSEKFAEAIASSVSWLKCFGQLLQHLNALSHENISSQCIAITDGASILLCGIFLQWKSCQSATKELHFQRYYDEKSFFSSFKFQH